MVLEHGLSNVSPAQEVQIFSKLVLGHFHFIFTDTVMWKQQVNTRQLQTDIRKVSKIAFDCHVTAICSNKNADYVKSLGADEVIDYTTENVLQTLVAQRSATREYDLIVDCVGGTELLGSYVCQKFPSSSILCPRPLLPTTKFSLQRTLLNPKGGYITIVGDKSSVKTLGGPITYLTHPAQILRYIKGYIWGPRYACV